MSGEVVMAIDSGLPGRSGLQHGGDFSLSSSEFVSLSGPSGPGKSTLLNIGGLDLQTRNH